jgi:hypothetical protein
VSATGPYPEPDESISGRIILKLILNRICGCGLDSCSSGQGLVVELVNVIMDVRYEVFMAVRMMLFFDF